MVTLRQALSYFRSACFLEWALKLADLTDREKRFSGTGRRNICSLALRVMEQP